MNNLSWLLYWADTLPKLSSAVCVSSFLLFVISLVLIAVHLADRVERLWFAKLLAPLFLILWVSSFLVPSKETFYLIAASEAGERALAAPEVSKVRDLVSQWLDKKLNDDDDPKANGEGDKK